MQVEHQKYIGKRSRYYQSTIDMAAIERGDKYRDLKNSMVIFICLFDPFGKGMHRYTFDEQCMEVRGLVLDDGAQKLILNTKQGTENDVNDNVRQFLKFVEDINDVGNDPDLLTLRDKVEHVRMSAEGEAAIYENAAVLR